MILPIIVITTQEALRAVPAIAAPGGPGAGCDPLADGPRPCAALGAAGHLTGTILGLSRAIGETAPLLMVGAAGSILRLPRGPLDRYSALPGRDLQLCQAAGREFQTVAAGGILILVALLLAMNAAPIVIRNRYRRYH